MRKNWRKELILQFELATLSSNIQQVDDDGNPCEKSVYTESVVFAQVDMRPYWKDALYWYKKAALHNEPLAIKLLQCAEEFNQVQKKAVAGDKDAQYRLSFYYHDSYGIPLDLYKSSDWLRIAAQNGSKEAIESIEDWNRFTKSRQKLSDADFYAEPGLEPDGYEDLCMLERHGRIKKEYFEKTHLDVLWQELSKLDFEETKFLAMAGEPEKQYQLAWLYDWGKGCQQDMKKAIEWFVESAYNQYGPAQTELGIMYQYGIMATKVRLKVFDGNNEH
ncbi:MAG: sel1 repeat family protein [Acidaminococcaceae bacterium]|nr:sel1 repeat family protein [Acidaminococcaceae bacterium]